MRIKILSKDVILVLIASFFYMSCTMMITPIIAGFTAALGGTGFLMGFIGGLLNLVSLGCRPFAGNLADKVDEFHLAIMGAGLMLVGCIGYCITTSILILVIARVLNGIGFACCTVGMSTWISILLPKGKVGFGMGIYGTTQALGMATAPYLGIEVQRVFGYRQAFLVAAIFALITILITLLIKNHGSEEQTQESSKRTGIQIIDKNVIPVALLVMLFTIPYISSQSFLISVVEKKGLPVNSALFFPMYAVALVVIRVGFRNYFDKVPYRKFLFIGIISSILSLLSLNFMKSNIYLALAAIFMAGSYGLMCSVSQTSAISLAGPGKRGIANSTYYVGLDLGGTLGAIIGGVLYGAVDIDLFYLILILCPVFCVIIYFVFRKNLRLV